MCYLIVAHGDLIPKQRKSFKLEIASQFIRKTIDRQDLWKRSNDVADKSAIQTLLIINIVLDIFLPHLLHLSLNQQSSPLWCLKFGHFYRMMRVNTMKLGALSGTLLRKMLLYFRVLITIWWFTFKIIKMPTMCPCAFIVLKIRL